jgi:hypothetical protein
MKVSELIAQLQDFDPEAEVKFVHSSSDYWGSMLASDVTQVGNAMVKYSEYHRNDKVIDYTEGDEEGAREVVVLE